MSENVDQKNSEYGQVFLSVYDSINFMRKRKKNEKELFKISCVLI